MLLKIRRIATRSFENAVRLHEDAVFLFDRRRFPSALHSSILSIEELGKYFMYEDVWWHNSIGELWTQDGIQEFLWTS
ncbi:MAG: AbiV family abortive infection protein [Kiritimatiellia bacterium]|nr:AbiV family abortive infection protein [Kiritimatiellia bacterium]